MRKIDAAIDSAQMHSAAMTVGFGGAKRPKLAKITVTQKTSTTRNGIWSVSPPPAKQHPAGLLYLPDELERLGLERALGLGLRGKVADLGRYALDRGRRLGGFHAPGTLFGPRQREPEGNR